MTKDNPFVGGFKIVAITQAFGGGSTIFAQSENAGGDEFAVEAVGNQVYASGGNDDPKRVNGFTALQGDSRQATGAGQGDSQPDQVLGQGLHDLMRLSQ
jgi:hypothetical protein